MRYLSRRSLVASILGMQCLVLWLTPIANASQLSLTKLSNSPKINLVVQNPNKRPNSPISVPPQIANAVRRHLSYKTNIPPASFKIKQGQRQTWPDGCLGLSEAGEFCTMSVVEGWRVVLSYRDKTWTYRTNSNGGSVRLEKQSDSAIANKVSIPNVKPVSKTSSTNLAPVSKIIPSNPVNKNNVNIPASAPISTVNIPNIILGDILKELSLKSILPSQFTVKIERKAWKDGCLELGGNGTFCTAAFIPGWQVTLESGQKRWIYHADLTGNEVRLNSQLSR